jgi:ElaB/YqjD/DUF883 family membrane-anchored ribosome-binding protein
MSNQDFERDRWATSQTATEGTSRDAAGKSQGAGKSHGLGDRAQQAFSKASDMARDAGEKAKRAASDTAASASETVKDLLNRQIGTGVGLAGHFAKAVRLAADDLERESPMAAGFVRGVASRVDGYAEGLQDQTVEQLARSASDYTRRQPALVFGLAALAGFFVFRTIKSAQPVASPSIQPVQQGNNGRF